MCTDHKNLAYLQSAKRLNARQARCALFFTCFCFLITYRPGSHKVKPDALSHQFSVTDDEQDPAPVLPVSCLIGAVTWEIKLGSPANQLGPWKWSISVALQSCHHPVSGTSLCSHSPPHCTTTFLQRYFFWSTLSWDAHEYMAACSTCAQNKPSNQPLTGLLQPLSMPPRPWPHIALDFVTGLLLSAGNNTILTIVVHFSKAAHFVALPKLSTALETAQLLNTHGFFCLHGRTLFWAGNRSLLLRSGRSSAP